jgi:hypothetical protein
MKTHRSPVGNNAIFPVGSALRHPNIPTQAKNGLEWATRPLTTGASLHFPRLHRVR